MSGSLLHMKTITVTELARSIHSVLNTLEQDQEEIVLVRNHRQIARLVPEPEAQDALAVFSDLYQTLDDSVADSLCDAVETVRQQPNAKLNAMRNPWDS